jgi:hypothetical protein
LAEQVAEELDDLVTAGLWCLGDDTAHVSDVIDSETTWADGMDLFVRFGMNAQEAVFGPTGQSWAELGSLSTAQAKLAIELSGLASAGPLRLGLEENDTMLAAPTDSASTEVTLEAAEATGLLLAQVGIEWEVPTAQLVAAQQAKDDARRERVLAQLGDSVQMLFEAVRAGDLELLLEYVASGAELDARTIEDQFEYTPAGDTAVVQALKSGHERCALALLEAGASHELSNSFGQTALFWAAQKGSVEVTRELLKRGADPNHIPGDGRSPLHVAAAEGYDELVDLLLEGGADRNAATWRGRTPAELAALRGHHMLAKRLKVSPDAG